ncbi:hypothetical protein COO91_07043 [Nostoc flagelliforme CCNUN1]|uniref:Uncharacterized protein n=1 Tax=Nostoc flagelliforme CCNUN1 TaxID=2038116 RepID=A0A2K8T1Y4_9NOSO|nr:hypothetical protein [Nostoc flagelliforme]AUB41005.1 hypothetical protein COO91_07043 [Nostoc flagelliforme CCNUN1]
MSCLFFLSDHTIGNFTAIAPLFLEKTQVVQLPSNWRLILPCHLYFLPV